MIPFIKKYWYYIIIGGFILFSLILSIDLPKQETAAEPSIFVEPTIQDEPYIYVDIQGSVLNPGVYKVDSTYRLFQLIRKAGGFTEDADPSQINQSIQLVDETFIYIPSIYDKVEKEEFDFDEQNNDLININDASKEVLETLPGIGPMTAQAIIDYRDENESFRTIEEIMDVPGIGVATFNEIKDFITV